MRKSSRPEIRPALRARHVAASVACAVESLETRRLFTDVLETARPALADVSPTAQFGEVVATRGNFALVGQQWVASSAGVAAVGQAKLVNTVTGDVTLIANPYPDEGDYFGGAVTFIDDTHFAINSFENLGIAASPRVYIYTFDNAAVPDPQNPNSVVFANPKVVESPVEPPSQDDFGNTLAAVGGDLLVSAPSAFGFEGAVYRYAVDGSPENVVVVGPEGAVSNVYRVQGSSGLGGTIAADARLNGTAMFFSSGAADSRRVFEFDTAGLIANYDEKYLSGSGGSFAIAFNDNSVFVGDTNLGRVTQFTRTESGALGDVVDDISIPLRDGEFSGFGSSLAVNGEYVIVADQSRNIVTVYDDNFGDLDNVALATTSGGQSFAALGAVRNLAGQKILVADPGADMGAGLLYVFDLSTIGGNSGPTATLSGGNVVVAGTGDVDAITVRIVNGLLQVFSGTDVIGSFSVGDVTGVSITGGAGDDTITSDSTNTFPTVIRGGDGKDTIRGGGGNDFLFGDGGNDVLSASQGNDVAIGGAGNDRVRGGTGRDVLIGGDGADDVEGNSADDVLVAGSTSYDGDAETDRLATVRDQWLSPDVYANRIAAIELLSDFKMLGDDDTDTVQGGSGMDWFLVEDEDVLKDLKRSETVNEVV